MKRGGRLNRHTELARSPFTRGPSRRTRRVYEELAIELDEDDWCNDPLWPIAKLVTLKRDRFTCANCGQAGGDPHHRFARQIGGRLDDPHRHDPQRLITCCRRCHNWVHDHPTAAKAIGFIVTTAEDALRVPVQTWTGLVLLGHDGRMTTTIPRLRG